MMRKTGMPRRRLGREAYSRARVLLQHKAAMSIPGLLLEAS